MSKLGIAFGDNDFYTTIVSFLENLPDEWMAIKDKKKLVFLVNQSLFTFYIMHQNCCKYNRLQVLDKVYIEHMKNYLTVNQDQIYLDDEVTDYIREQDGWDNSEFFFKTSTGVEVI